MFSLNHWISFERTEEEGKEEEEVGKEEEDEEETFHQHFQIGSEIEKMLMAQWITFPVNVFFFVSGYEFFPIFAPSYWI